MLIKGLQSTNAVDDDHRRLRNKFRKALNSKAVVSQEEILQRYAVEFVDGIQKELNTSNGIVNIAKWFSLATFDIITDLSFGKSFENLKRGKLHAWGAVIFGAFKALPFLRVFREVPGVTRLGNVAIFLLPRKLMQMWYSHFEYAFKLIEDRTIRPNDRKDFVHYFL